MKQVVSPELVAAARKAVETRKDRDLLGQGSLGADKVMTDLINRSELGAIMRNLMGPYDAPIRSFPAIRAHMKRYPRKGGQAGVPWSEHPISQRVHGAPLLHIDGSWTGTAPKCWDEIDDATGAPKNRAAVFGDEFANDKTLNMTPLWQDRQKSLALGSFTAFVGVALNDQLTPGCG